MDERWQLSVVKNHSDTEILEILEILEIFDWLIISTPDALLPNLQPF
jgi:hypothetical protein